MKNQSWPKILMSVENVMNNFFKNRWLKEASFTKILQKEFCIYKLCEAQIIACGKT